MMDFGLVASGMAIGVAVAAPIGPVNLIVIRRTLRFGAVTGFLSGAGSAMGDGVFASVAAFGLTAAIDFVVRFAAYMQFAGGLFLLGLGLKAFFAHPHLVDDPSDNPYRVARVFASTFALTITNPATMFGFLAIFSGVAGLSVRGESYGHATTLVASVVSGSVLWWLCLSQFVNLFRQRMNDRLLEIVNRISGALIAGFGAIVLIRVLVLFFG